MNRMMVIFSDCDAAIALAVSVVGRERLDSFWGAQDQCVTREHNNEQRGVVNMIWAGDDDAESLLAAFQGSVGSNGIERVAPYRDDWESAYSFTAPYRED